MTPPNSARAGEAGEPTTGRHVHLICGPPGAGKSTYAERLAMFGLAVIDVDAEPFNGDESAMVEAMRAIGSDPHANAVVIRSGATLTARASAAAMIGATTVTVLTTRPDLCAERIRTRNRPRPPIAQQIAAVASWWRTYEPAPAESVPASRQW